MDTQKNRLMNTGGAFEAQELQRKVGEAVEFFKERVHDVGFWISGGGRDLLMFAEGMEVSGSGPEEMSPKYKGLSKDHFTNIVRELMKDEGVKAEIFADLPAIVEMNPKLKDTDIYNEIESVYGE